MPDPAPSKRQYHPPPLWSGCTQSVAYAELHCKTNFSFLEGASHPDELVVRAAELGYQALAITDLNSVAGVVRAHTAAKDLGLKLLIGAEVTPDDALAVVLWATNRVAYGRLCRLLTRGRMRASKGECQLHFAEIAEHAEGLLAGVLLAPKGVGSLFHTNPTRESGGTIHNSASLTRPVGMKKTPDPFSLSDYREVFGDRCYAIAELHRGPDDRRLLRKWMGEAREHRVPLVAANDVHYHVPARQSLQDVLTAIRHGCTVADLGTRRFVNAERYLKPSQELAALFADCPEALARTVEIADRCTFSLDELRYDYPEELCPEGLSPHQHLTQLTWAGAQERYPDGLPEKVRKLIEHELQLVDELHYAPYFLTVWDLVRFARSRDILCQGRGSAANSVICYCLGVTSVDPALIDVLFERFISKERNEAPDIDVDFEHERREEVLQYLYDKYGRDRAGMTAEVITYRPRSAVRDVGKALGLSLDRIDSLAKHVDHHENKNLPGRLQEAGLPGNSLLGRQLSSLVHELLGFPRHLSQHVGGMVMTQGPLCELVPIENAAMPGRTVISWDKDDLDSLGILKVDCLALGMLTAIRKSFDLLQKHYHRPLTLATVPAEDPAVYEMCCRSDTMGVFQIESRAQMAMLPRLRPCRFYDLVIEVAIVRPGPIQGDMVHPYLRRRAGEEPVNFPDERVKEVLVKTMGVPIFQEQAMRLAIVAAGFTPGEADQLRRAMGAWRRQGVIEQFSQKLVNGMIANGYSAEFAERLFNQIRGFGEYGFPESHAASFALLVYCSAWIKCYYPAVFAAALLNSQPMGFYAPAQLVANARQHDVEVRPVDVNHSDWDCTLEEIEVVTRQSLGAVRPQAEPGDEDGNGEQAESVFALRLGFRMVQGLSKTLVERLIAERRKRLFDSWEDFARRTGFSRALLSRLSRADAFRSLAASRRESLWRSLPETDRSPLFVDQPDEEEVATLPAMPVTEEVIADYRSLGLSLRAHPVSFLREELERRKIIPAKRLGQLKNGQLVTVAGIVLMRQRPSSASGVTFVTLEDETGFTNLIIHARVWEQHYRIARAATLLQAQGKLQCQGDVIHVIVSRMKDLSEYLRQLPVASRDFR